MKRWNKLKMLMAGLVVVGMGVLGPVGTAGAVTCPEGSIRGDLAKSTGDASKGEVPNIGLCNVEPNVGNGTDSEQDIFFYVNRIINIALGLLGLVSVIMIIVSGIQIATAGGDPGKVERGKRAIMFAVAGLVIALLAFAIVNFVLGNVFN